MLTAARSDLELNGSCRPRWALLWIALPLCVTRAVLASDLITALAPVPGAGIERGVTRVICSQPGSTFFVRMRAAVLDIGATTPAHDVVLAPRHGLPRDSKRISENCHLVGARGAEVGIAEYWLPHSSRGGIGDDWAVLMTDVPFGSGAGHLRPAALTPDALEDLRNVETSVKVMLYSEDVDLHNCELRRWLAPNVVVYSCPSWRGLSGAPLLLGVGGETVVIGMDVRMLMRAPDGRGPLIQGVGLLIDTQIAAAIGEAAKHARRVAGSRGAIRARQR